LNFKISSGDKTLVLIYDAITLDSVIVPSLEEKSAFDRLKNEYYTFFNPTLGIHNPNLFDYADVRGGGAFHITSIEEIDIISKKRK
tara:strand:- start:560 stop:817 length:258 start_codon:yes stop_codon:yes gene_type:complete